MRTQDHPALTPAQKREKEETNKSKQQKQEWGCGNSRLHSKRATRPDTAVAM
jgi:hypothetical protein